MHGQLAKHMRHGFLLLLGACIFVPPTSLEAQQEPPESRLLSLNLRSKQETTRDSGRYHTTTKSVNWQPRQTAIVVCDMWDKHWCPTSTSRVAEMAPRMNEVIKAARQKGVLIIHCPSGTLDFYKDSPQRKLAMAAPKVTSKVPLQGWCHLMNAREGKLPIDDSDGGCDCTDQEYRKNFQAWSRQIEAIEIAPNDAVTDSAEAFYLMKQRSISNVIVMGVHTNMCVLGRPFAIRQMVLQGQNVVLMRDMTDTMYNPAMSPRVSHFTGTDLVVDHIEKYWCPTITSADILGGEPFRFQNDKRRHLVILSAEREYRTNESLPKFAAEHLGKEFRVSFVFDNANDRNDLPGLEILKSADAVLVSVRRRVLPEAQMNLVRSFIESGKPVIGIRTASHAFSLHKEDPPAGYRAWTEFDRDIIGGSYTGHHGNSQQSKIAAAGGAKHSILAGVNVEKLVGHGSLYRVSPLQKNATAVLTGTIPQHPTEPVAWVSIHSGGGRVFYTSLGHIDDFAQANFNTMLANAVRWAVSESDAQ
jgi:type 1 glutamine amidotransferase/nicotinamidase-related amidase